MLLFMLYKKLNPTPLLDTYVHCTCVAHSRTHARCCLYNDDDDVKEVVI